MRRFLVAGFPAQTGNEPRGAGVAATLTIASRKGTAGRAARSLGRLSPLLLLLGILAAWELVAELGLFNPILLGRPTIIAANLVQGLLDGSLLVHLTTSVVSLLLGYSLACLVGIPVGLVMGMDWRVGAALDPLVLLLYAAPLVAFYPLLIIWFGVGTPTVVVLAFLIGVFPIILNSMLGARLTDAVLIRTAVSFGATRRDLFSKIVAPSAVPLILAGMRLGAGRSVVGVIAGEFFGANAGLGFLISNAGTKLRTNDLLVGVILAGLLGVMVTQILTRVEAWVNRRMGRATVPSS
jgi:ABC-type nitrate/sulfonate/bicarbonate transport system permease component